jgi:hypothetical protein
MTFTDYAISIALILLVFTQIRDRRLDRRAFLVPVLAVAAAADYYLKEIPTRGHDVALYVILGTIGAAIGAAAGLATKVWRAGDNTAHSKAGLTAALLWIGGLGCRLAFEIYATHGGAAQVTSFSVTNRISGVDAWMTALVMMALAEVIARLVVLRVQAARVMSHQVERSSSELVMSETAA